MGCGGSQCKRYDHRGLVPPGHCSWNDASNSKSTNQMTLATTFADSCASWVSQRRGYHGGQAGIEAIYLSEVRCI